MVGPQAEPCPSSAGTAATARPSRTQTRRRCTIRMGRVSAAAQDLGAKRRSRWEAVLVWGWHRWEGDRCPQNRQEPQRGRMSQAQPLRSVQFAILGFADTAEDAGDPLPREVRKVLCSCTVLRTISGGFIFSWTRTPAAETPENEQTWGCLPPTLPVCP